MGSLRSMKTDSIDVEKLRIERKLATFKETVEYLLSAFEKTGLPRDHKGQHCERTLEENCTGMIKALTQAHEGEFRTGLPQVLYAFHMDLYDFTDHFVAYEHEHGVNLEPRNEMSLIEEKAQDIAVLILVRKIKHWNKGTVIDLRVMREDLKKAIAHSLGQLEGRYRNITDVLKPSAIPTANLPCFARDVDIIAVDEQGGCLVSEPVEIVRHISEIEDDRWGLYW